MGFLAEHPYRTLSRCLCHIRLSRLIALITGALILMPLIAQIYLPFYKPEDLLASGDEEVNLDSLKLGVQELVRIRVSVLNELRSLDQKRLKLLEDVRVFKENIFQLKENQEVQKGRVNVLKLSIRELEDERRKLLVKRVVRLPAKLKNQKKKSRRK